MMRASILIDGNFLDYRDKKNFPMPVISQTSNKSQEIVKELETIRQKTIEEIDHCFPDPERKARGGYAK